MKGLSGDATELNKLVRELTELVGKHDDENKKYQETLSKTAQNLDVVKDNYQAVKQQIPILQKQTASLKPMKQQLLKLLEDYVKELEKTYRDHYTDAVSKSIERKKKYLDELDQNEEELNAALDQCDTFEDLTEVIDEHEDAWGRFEKKYPWFSKRVWVCLDPNITSECEICFCTISRIEFISKLWHKLLRLFHLIPEWKQLEIFKTGSKLHGKYADLPIEERPVDDYFSDMTYNERLKYAEDYLSRLMKKVDALDDIRKTLLDQLENVSPWNTEFSYQTVVAARLKLVESKLQVVRDRVIARHPECPKEFLKHQANRFPDIFWSPTDQKDAMKDIEDYLVNQQNLYEKEERELQSKLVQLSAQINAETEAIQRLTAQGNNIPVEQSAAIKKWLERFYEVKKRDPLLAPIWNPGDLTEEDAVAWCSQVAAAAAQRTIMENLPIGYEEISTSAGIITVPKLLPWQAYILSGRHINFIFEYTPQEQMLAVTSMNVLLLNMLLAFPAKQLKFTFVDLNITNAPRFFLDDLDDRLYNNNQITKEQELNKKLDELHGRMVSISKVTTNVLDHHYGHGEFVLPYEVIVLLDFPGNLSSQCMTLLKPLMTNGYKGGVFFVVMRDTEAAAQNTSRSSAPDPVTPECFQTVPLQQDQEDNDRLLSAYTSVGNYWLRRVGFNYINHEAQQEQQTRKISQPMAQLYQAPLEDAAAQFKVATGEASGRVSWFQLDEINHIHSFVLGQSGSGKSVFLHNVITNAVLSYSPESLQLYLLDFKLGGVEFNRYKDVKHVKALLVDNSDQQITLEILRGVYQTMHQRGEQLRNAGVSSLKEYNAAHPDSKLARIILVADECHELFRDRVDKTQSEINAIVSKIAKEGRNQGVHLLFATQTLVNANISQEILNNITDHYLLQCAQNDAEKLVRDSSKKTSVLATGGIFYNHFNEQQIFQAYFADKDQMQQNIEEALRKSASFPDEDRFFFSGKQNFYLDAEVAQTLEHKGRRTPYALMGKSIDLMLDPIGFPFKTSMSENVLLFGINTKEQTSRTSLNLLISLMISYRRLNRACDFYVINCMNATEQSDSEDLLYALEPYGCRVVEDADRGELLGRLGEEVRSHTARESVVLLLGQERFREMRLELPLGKAETPELPTTTGSLGDLGSLGRPRTEKRTYKSELRYLLQNGPEHHVHFLLQVDKPGNLLFENVISQQLLFSMFKHVVMLKSAPDAALKLRLSDDLKLENLSEDINRLRAYYYNDEEGTYTLFTPYINPTPDQLESLF